MKPLGDCVFLKSPILFKAVLKDSYLFSNSFCLRNPILFKGCYRNSEYLQAPILELTDRQEVDEEAGNNGIC